HSTDETKAEAQPAEGVGASGDSPRSVLNQVEAEATTTSMTVSQEEIHIPLSAAMEKQINELLALLTNPTKFPQARVEGEQNVWMIKPAGKSRGRKIQLFNTLHEIHEHIATASVEFLPSEPKDDDVEDMGPDSQLETWVVQRYVESPLTPHGRKMDIRQWVVVTNWEPLTVWFYRDCYVRFCAEDYDLKDISNLYQHLSNNSIAAKSDAFEEDAIGELNMWTWQQLADYIITETGEDLFNGPIAKAMRSIVISSLLSVQGVVKPRKNSFEVYGYDFLLDENYGVWLLEVNSSPCLEHSTAITAELCKNMMEDLVKLLVDQPQESAQRPPGPQSSPPASARDPGGEAQTSASPPANGKGAEPVDEAREAAPPSSSVRRRESGRAKPVNAGGWECIYRGDPIPFRTHACITNLLLKGEPICIHPVEAKKPHKQHHSHSQNTDHSERAGKMISVAHALTLAPKAKQRSAKRRGASGRRASVSCKGLGARGRNRSAVLAPPLQHVALAEDGETGGLSNREPESGTSASNSTSTLEEIAVDTQRTKLAAGGFGPGTQTWKAKPKCAAASPTRDSQKLPEKNEKILRSRAEMDLASHQERLRKKSAIPPWMCRVLRLREKAMAAAQQELLIGWYAAAAKVAAQHVAVAKVEVGFWHVKLDSA
ncbi:hypothetical protein CYMTET_51672, partial [Cymbomonas tetramitiformis]